MQELGCSISAIATYSAADLKKKNILVEVHPPFQTLQKNMKITFKALDNGGIQLVVNVAHGKSQNTLKSVTIPEEKLNLMKRSEKSEQSPIGNPGEEPFMTFVSCKLVELITTLKEGVK